LLQQPRRATSAYDIPEEIRRQVQREMDEVGLTREPGHSAGRDV
jgi:hypothetical protein